MRTVTTCNPFTSNSIVRVAMNLARVARNSYLARVATNGYLARVASNSCLARVAMNSCLARAATNSRIRGDQDQVGCKPEVNICMRKYNIQLRGLK